MDIQEVLRLHGLWLRGEAGGSRADLTGTDLTGADLTGADLTRAVLTRADLTRADLTRADLTGADLTGAVFTRAVLTRADLTGADLTGADLTGAVLRGAVLRDGLLSLLKVPRLHQLTLASIDAGGVLEMGSWHLRNAACGTQHCRAGWYIHHAGAAGAMAEAILGPAAAGALIAVASCPYLERVPDFYADNEEALADIRRCALLETEAGLQEAL